MKKDCFFCPQVRLVKAEPIKILPVGSVATRGWRFLSSEPIGLKGLDREQPRAIFAVFFIFCD